MATSRIVLLIATGTDGARYRLGDVGTAGVEAHCGRQDVPRAVRPLLGRQLKVRFWPANCKAAVRKSSIRLLID